MKKLLIAMGLGAALAWAFDPDQGSRRREHVKRQLEAKGLMRPTTSGPAAVSDYRPAGETISA